MLSVMNERDPVISCFMASMNMSFRAGVLVAGWLRISPCCGWIIHLLGLKKMNSLGSVDSEIPVSLG